MSTETLPQIDLLEYQDYKAPIVDRKNGGAVTPKEDEKWWGSFHQWALIQSHETPEGVIKKVVLVSKPLPPGTEEMGRTIIKSTMKEISGRDAAVVSFNEDKTLLAAMYKTDKTVVDQELIDTYDIFAATTESVIRDSHQDLKSAPAQEYLMRQELSKNSVGRLKARVSEIISNPEFMQTSAWDSDFDDAILQEFIFKNGVLKAIAPDGTEMTIDGKLAVGNFGHSSWLDSLKELIGSVKGVAILEDYDGTETVSECGNSKGCSEFFEQRIGHLSMSDNVALSEISSDIKHLTIGKSITTSSSASTTRFSGGGGNAERLTCKSCGKDKIGSEGHRCECGKTTSSN